MLSRNPAGREKLKAEHATPAGAKDEKTTRLKAQRLAREADEAVEDNVEGPGARPKREHP